MVQPLGETLTVTRRHANGHSRGRVSEESEVLAEASQQFSPHSDTVEALAQRLAKSGELIRQLKHIVKAQHTKIEELGERLNIAESPLRETMAQQEKDEMQLLKEENDDFRRQVNQLKAEQVRLKGDNDTLRKANRRLKAIITQESMLPGTMQPEGNINSFASADTGKGQGGTKDCQLPSATPRPEQSLCEFPTATFVVPGGTPPSSGRSSKLKEGKPLPPHPKVSRLLNSLPLFWREMDSPVSTLYALLEVAERLLNDVPNVVLTLYVADAYLRQEAAALEGRLGISPTLFYLGQGEITLQVFPARRPTNRPDAPRFADLQALPYRARSTLAVALQMPNAQRTLAILQATCGVQEEAKAGSPRGHRRHGERPPERTEATETPAFSDSHMAFFQLVCHLTASFLFYTERLEQHRRALGKQKACVEVAVAVNKARTLADFEQRVKHLLGPFFSASLVRVLFFDADNQKLLMPSSQMRRKDYTPQGIDKGIVGLCAKRRAVVSVPNILQHPCADAQADGLQRGGKPITGSSAVLCGPMLVEADDGGEATLLGVVEILERRRKAGQTLESQFSEEEESLFVQILQVLAHAGWRALKIQELSARLEGAPTTLSRLLLG